MFSLRDNKDPSVRSLFDSSARQNAELFQQRLYSAQQASFPEVSSIIGLLQQGPWAPSEKSLLLMAAQSLMAKAAKCGECMNTQKIDPINYINVGIKDFLCGEINRSKIMAWAKHLNRLGVYHPSEKTMQRCTAALLCLTIGAEDSLQRSLMENFSLFSDLKKHVQGKSFDSLILSYPIDPVELKQQRPQIFHSVFGDDPILKGDIFCTLMLCKRIFP